MSYTNGTTKTELEYNIFNEMRNISSETANTYCKLGGYTRGNNGIHVTTMVPPGENKTGVLVSHLGSTKISSVKNDICHANDCTYYDGIYYVATGGGDVESNIVKRYDANLNRLTPDCTCPGNVTCIAHFLSDYFLLGNGKVLTLCRLENKHTFTTIKELELPEGSILGGWVRQGMCYFDNYLYKIYSEKTSGKIHKNYIAKYKVDGVSSNPQNFKKEVDISSLVAVYACNNELVHLFELQSIDVSHNEIFIAINMWISSKDPSSRICKVTLTN